MDVTSGIQLMKDSNRFCDRKCSVDQGRGFCVGKGEAMPGRPFVVYGAGDQAVLVDLTTDRIDSIPVGCPFFKVGTERG